MQNNNMMVAQMWRHFL